MRETKEAYKRRLRATAMGIPAAAIRKAMIINQTTYVLFLSYGSAGSVSACRCLQRIGLQIGLRIGWIGQADNFECMCRYLVGSQSKGHGDAFAHSSSMRHIPKSALLMGIDDYVGKAGFLLLNNDINSPAQILS